MREKAHNGPGRIFRWRTWIQLILIYVIFNSLIEGINVVIRGVTEGMVRPLVLLAILVNWFLISGIKSADRKSVV